MSSNYCKNLVYDGCELNRFDAHMGIYNATIRHSSIGVLSLIGCGTLTVEDTIIYTNKTNQIVSLRNDYGSTWEGDFIFKDVTVVYNGTSSTMNILGGTWYNHYFGYACSAPKTITIDNLTIMSNTVTTVHLATGSITNDDISDDQAGAVKNENPYAKTEKLIIKNNTKGYTFTVPVNSDTVIEHQ